MPGPIVGWVSLIAQIPSDFLGLSASQWFWVAIVGWSLGVVLGGLLAARAVQGAPGQGEVSPERIALDTPAILRAVAPDEDAAGGVLRWLLGEVDADAVAHLELSPLGETLRIEPRGLEGASVARLAELARSALLGSEPLAEGVGVARWVGAGGTNALVATGTAIPGHEEPLRFSRYLLEWVRSAERGRPRGDLEDRLREVSGVTWVEVVGRSARLLAEDEASAEVALAEVARRLEGTGVAPVWIDAAEPRPDVPTGGPVAGAVGGPEPPVVAIPEAERSEAQRIPTEPIGMKESLVASAIGAQEPRIRLLDVALRENGEATADVRVSWNEQEIRGRGHGRATRAGRSFAAAQAVADALRPLLDTDVVIEGLYVATTKEGLDVLISEVKMEGQRYVGAVLERHDRPDWTGARAVLDAVNRRLVQVAGRSGRI
ncbi:MAG TPA: hypothetical protein VF097_09460 [Actinomycetota bacterium]